MISEVKPGTMVIALSGTDSSATEVVRGELSNITIEVPALTGTGTVTIWGTDNIGGTIYPIGTFLESTTGVLKPVGTPTHFNGTLYLSLNETSGTQSAAANVTYNLYYQAKQG